MLNWIVIKEEDKWKWVSVIAEIRDNETSEVREYKTKEILDNGEEYPSVFNWEDNNYSCDCNRRLFFNSANRGLKIEDFDVECSKGKFSVNLKNELNGLYYYKEF